MTLTQKIKALALGTVLAASITNTAQAEPKPFGKVAGYYDSRGKPTSTVIIGAAELPLGTALFSFMDFATEKADWEDLTPPYGEWKLSKKADYGLGVAVEYDRDFSQENGTIRVGFMVEPNLAQRLPNTFIGLNYYPASSGDQGGQVVVYGQARFLGGNLTLDGYLDYNFKPEKIVTDLQAGYRISGGLSAVVKGRYNSFLPEERGGLGVGLEWKL